MPEAKEDPKFLTMADRVKNLDDLTILITDWSSGFARSEIMASLNNARVPCGMVKDLGEVIEDENLHARGMIRWINDEEGQKSLATASPLHINGVNSVDYQAAPEIDANRDEILKELRTNKH